MGLKALVGTELESYIRNWAPCENEIVTVPVQSEYELRVHPQYVSMLGTMCDLGVRSYFPVREFAPTILYGRGAVLDILLDQFQLTAEQAYMMCMGKEPKYGLSIDLVDDYDNLVRRSIELFKCVVLKNPVFGKYYACGGVVKNFECDCVDDRLVIDLKVTREKGYHVEHWMQVLYYTMLCKTVDSVPRPTLGIVQPVEGTLSYYTYSNDVYYAMYHIFKEVYDAYR